jgi:hypothetical protein
MFRLEQRKITLLRMLACLRAPGADRIELRSRSDGSELINDVLHALSLHCL